MLRPFPAVSVDQGTVRSRGRFSEVGVSLLLAFSVMTLLIR